MIQTRNAWLLIYTAVRDRFENALTPKQVTAFDVFCNEKFPQGYIMNTETMGEIQTAVSLMTEFCKQVNITEWGQ